VLKVYGTKTDPTRPVRPSPPPTTTTTASPVRNSRTWLNTSSTATTMGSFSASGVVGPRSGHDSVARSKSGIDPSFFFSLLLSLLLLLFTFVSLLFSVLFFSFLPFLAMASSQVFCVVQCDACDPCHSPSSFAARIFCFVVVECFSTLAPLLINFED